MQIDYKKIFYISLVSFIGLISYVLYMYYLLSQDYNFLLREPYKKIINQQFKIISDKKKEGANKTRTPYLFGTYCPINILESGTYLNFPDKNLQAGTMFTKRRYNSLQKASYQITPDNKLELYVPSENYKEKVNIDYMLKNKMIIMYSDKDTTFSIFCSKDYKDDIKKLK